MRIQELLYGGHYLLVISVLILTYGPSVQENFSIVMLVPLSV